ncbi:hypothetical protein HPP92_006832 [Vanilla planifolia]|uniref:Uncharacterized protein n=1 Tax=Vanilla planifolia TaxID=51239 RepID=A0A835V750_VANPL|nr:hypothetical protein HPP92_006832 [Vanilla planifolia]
MRVRDLRAWARPILQQCVEIDDGGLHGEGVRSLSVQKDDLPDMHRPHKSGDYTKGKAAAITQESEVKDGYGPWMIV